MDVLALRSKTKRIQAGLQLFALMNFMSYLWPRDTPIDELSDYDFIIVGGGTAGSILASRLTKCGTYRVLLVEAGGDPPFESLYPGPYFYLPNSQYDWNFTTINDAYTTQEHKRNILELTSGKMLGGSSSLGHLLYIRGDPHDYYSWAKAVKDEAWNYENLLPYFKKSERLQDKEIFYSPSGIYHGYKGNVGLRKQGNKVSQKYLKAFKESDHNILLDANGIQTLGFYEPMFMIKNGLRQSMAYAYLNPAKNHHNLHVLKETEVIEIIFEGDKAVGVTAVKNDKIVTIKVKREIIVSAGAIKSPHLLMLSGIGPKDDLEGYKIPVKSNLPVGKHYQDHLGVILVHKLNIKNKKSRPDDPHKIPLPIIVGNAAFHKSHTYPDYQILNYIIPSDSDKILSLCSIDFSFKDELCQSLYNATKGNEVILTKLVLSHPKSKGHVVLENGNYKNPPIVIPGFYSHEEDLDDVAKYIEDFNQIVKTAFKNFEVEFVYPDLKECKFLQPFGPTYWKCYALAMMVTTYHYSSTCSMGTVVDSRLKVYGVKGLRVIDSSVIPFITSGHTQADVMVIAEKGADMILEDSKEGFFKF